MTEGKVMFHTERKPVIQQLTEQIAETDCRILRLVMNHRNRWLTVFFKIMTLFGEYGIFWIVLSGILLLHEKTESVGRQMSIALIQDFLLVNVILKNVVRRRRPYDRYQEFSILGRRQKDWSFPSGHTSVCFACFGVLVLGMNPVIPSFPFGLISFLTGFSRIYLGEHYPSDVVAGMICGMTVAFLSCRMG